MEYTIQDLCDETGLPRRTIHFYIQQQILPAPTGSGLGAHYQEEHLIRLKLIPILRSQGLKLDDIRRKFKDIGLGELENILSRNATVIAQPRLAPAPFPTIKEDGPLPQAYDCFTLPQGIFLFTPQNLHPRIKKALYQHLEKLRAGLSQSFPGGDE